MKKPREFWIAQVIPENDSRPYLAAYTGGPEQDSWIGEVIHVIEKSAYDELQKEVDEIPDLLTISYFRGAEHCKEKLELATKTLELHLEILEMKAGQRISEEQQREIAEYSQIRECLKTIKGEN